jgi:hypothetical protein
VELNGLIDKASRAMWPSGESGIVVHASEDGSEALDQISKLLLKPFMDHVKGREHIIFLTPGNLPYIPWAMLPRFNPQHLPLL